jgi:hypothetical protein
MQTRAAIPRVGHGWSRPRSLRRPGRSRRRRRPVVARWSRARLAAHCPGPSGVTMAGGMRVGAMMVGWSGCGPVDGHAEAEARLAPCAARFETGDARGEEGIRLARAPLQDGSVTCPARAHPFFDP